MNSESFFCSCPACVSQRDLDRHATGESALYTRVERVRADSLSDVTDDWCSLQDEALDDGQFGMYLLAKGRFTEAEIEEFSQYESITDIVIEHSKQLAFVQKLPTPQDLASYFAELQQDLRGAPLFLIVLTIHELELARATNPFTSEYTDLVLPLLLSFSRHFKPQFDGVHRLLAGTHLKLRSSSYYYNLLRTQQFRLAGLQASDFSLN